MPDTNESALDTPPPAEIHTYMTPSVGNSVVLLEPEVQQIVDEFSRERLELDTLKDEDSDGNLPEKVEADHSALIEQLGGAETAKSLIQVLSDPQANLAQVLPSEAVEDLVWTALDNPVTQSNILADPQVRTAISKELFFGHSIEQVQALLSQYERGDDLSPEQLQADYLAAETRVQDFQRSFFTSDINETIKNSGVDESDVEAVTDRLLLARCRFLDANHQEFLNVQSLHERGLSSQAAVPEARLHNKWMATLLTELGKLNGKPPAKVKTKPMNTQDSEQEDQPAKKIDAGIGNNGDWLHEFTKDFSAERQRRGLFTPDEKRRQGKH